MQVLAVLVERRGEVVGRDELIDRCWSGLAVGEDAIQRSVARIRKLAAEVGGFDVETIRRVGYRLVERRGPRARRRWMWALLAVLLSAVVGVGLWSWRHAQTVSPASVVSVAVLPFDDLAHAPATRALAATMDAQIGDALARSGLSVMATAAAGAGKRAPRTEAARQLGVRYLIDGDVSARPGASQVSVRLIDGQSGMTLGAMSLPVRPGGEAAAADEVARTLAAFITWPTLERSAAAGKGSRAEVVADTWRTLDLLRRGDALAAYGQARRVGLAHPDVAIAQVGWAINVPNALPLVPLRERARAVAEGRRAAARGLELDPRTGDAYAALAGLTPVVEWRTREGFFLRGLAVDPDSASLQSIYGEFLADTGRLREALEAAQRGVALDPGAPPKTDTLAERLFALGRSEEAARVLDRALAQPLPELARSRFRVAAWSGPPPAAQAVLADPLLAQALGNPDRDAPLRLIARALASSRAADREPVVRACSDAGALAQPDALDCLVALTRFRRLDAAFALAAQLYPDLRAPDAAARDARWLQTPASRDTRMLFIPAMAPFRADPRFAALTRRVGLADYWAQSGQRPDFCRTEPSPACPRA
jgi:TolB-like protein